MLRNANQPGQRASKGVYWVHHYQHRRSHVCEVPGGSFPICNTCRERVRFEFAQGRKFAPAIWNDVDFRPKSEDSGY